jgi:NAD(P)-dependent dehydrogenase (short-subunit alcohol dehydrogenase family)
MTRSLTGRVALVTGGAKGIGTGIAKDRGGLVGAIRDPHSTRSATVGSMRVAARAGQ